MARNEKLGLQSGDQVKIKAGGRCSWQQLQMTYPWAWCVWRQAMQAAGLGAMFGAITVERA
jgi:hypothetical protein